MIRWLMSHPQVSPGAAPVSPLRTWGENQPPPPAPGNKVLTRFQRHQVHKREFEANENKSKRQKHMQKSPAQDSWVRKALRAPGTPMRGECLKISTSSQHRQEKISLPGQPCSPRHRNVKVGCRRSQMSLPEHFAFLLQSLILNPPSPTTQRYLPKLGSVQISASEQQLCLFLISRHDPPLDTSQNPKSSWTPRL